MDRRAGRPRPAPSLVGIDTVVSDGLLAFGWQMEECGGDEIGSLENLEVALGVVMALGAVDDGLACGVPGHLL